MISIRIIFYLFIFLFFSNSLYAKFYSCENYLITPGEGLNESIIFANGSPDINLIFFRDLFKIIIFIPIEGQKDFDNNTKSGPLISGETSKKPGADYIEFIEFNITTNHLTYKLEKTHTNTSSWFDYKTKDGLKGSSKAIYNYYRCKHLDNLY